MDPRSGSEYAASPAATEASLSFHRMSFPSSAFASSFASAHCLLAFPYPLPVKPELRAHNGTISPTSGCVPHRPHPAYPAAFPLNHAFHTRSTPQSSDKAAHSASTSGHFRCIPPHSVWRHLAALSYQRRATCRPFPRFPPSDLFRGTAFSTLRPTRSSAPTFSNSHQHHRLLVARSTCSSRSP
ncbi:hypothetical protein K438DRAFT_1977355 [Mycena galopus ATCC 62051]|nr:hypothetical protein K438DRAFT_1977355 [Mycena galopus ATCC 62051]